MKTATAAKKITKATFKSFVKRNRASLLIKTKSSFDGMCDGVREVEDNGFSKALDKDNGWSRDTWKDNNLGIHGIWLVGSSRDYFSSYADGTYSGIEVYNCCGSYIVAVKD